jgi:hypothetical protein
VQLTETCEPAVTPVTNGNELLSKLQDGVALTDEPESAEEMAEAMAGAVTVAATTARAAMVVSAADHRSRTLRVMCESPVAWRRFVPSESTPVSRPSTDVASVSPCSRPPVRLSSRAI